MVVAAADATAGIGITSNSAPQHPAGLKSELTAHVANAVVQMANLPLDTNILNMTIMATTMPFVGRG